MRNKASVLTVRVPSHLKHKIEKVAGKQGVSINQFALYAFTKEVKEMETFDYLSKRWKNKSRSMILKNFDRAMENVGSKKSPAWDKL